MVVICNIYKTVRDLLPHFYTHYLSYGVNEFLFGLHNGTDNPVYQEIFDLAPAGTIIEVVESYRGQICGRKEGETLNKLRLRVQSEWVVPTDLDEFHVPLSFGGFPELATFCDEKNADYVLSTLTDMIAEDGSIPLSIAPNVPIEKQFPRQADLTKTILKACDQKVLLSRQNHSLTDGHHCLGEGRTFDPSPVPLLQRGKTLHYKWFGNLREKEEEKHRSYKELGYDFSEENRRLLDYLRLYNGKLIP